MRIVMFFFLVVSSSWSIEIDMRALEQDIQTDSTNVSARIILAREYITHEDFDRAKKLLAHVLTLDDKDKKANFLISEIAKLQNFKSLIKSNALVKNSKVTSHMNKLFKNKNHNEIVKIHKLLKRNNIPFESTSYLKILKSYMALSKYNEALYLAENAPLSDQNRYFLKARIKELKGETKESENLYLKALKQGDRKDISLSLYNFYVDQNRLADAKELLNYYQSKGVKNRIFLALKKRDKALLFQRASKLEGKYKDNRLFKDFKKYYYELEGLGYKQKALQKLKTFVSKNPNDEEAILFLAKQYYWSKNSIKSLALLKPLIKRTENKEILDLYKTISSQLREPKAVASPKVNPSDTLKQKAETYFFKKDYKNSISYYGLYFKRVSNDNSTRFHYASALENLKKYPQSEKQYRLVAQKRDKLFNLALYRYARVLMIQKDDTKWAKAKVVLRELLKILNKQKPSKERDDILKYAKKSWEIVKKPMPKPSKHKDIMLTEVQKKILDGKTLSGVKLDVKYISSVKPMIDPSESNIKKFKKVDISIDAYFMEDENMRNISYGTRVSNFAQIDNSSLSMGIKKSNFKTVENRNINTNITNTKKSIDVLSVMAYYNFKNLSIGLGVDKFDDFNDFVAKLEYYHNLSNHSLSYVLSFENGIFETAATCMVEKDIDVISFALYDSILLKNLEQAEFTLEINNFSDNNLNINTFINHPINKIVYSNFANVFSIAGSYEYNSKSDTCYGAVDFFDGNYLQMRPKYKFLKDSYIEGIVSAGYSFKSNEALYAYGFIMKLMTEGYLNLSLDCHHYQSGYSPDGADECFASIMHIW